MFRCRTSVNPYRDPPAEHWLRLLPPGGPLEAWGEKYPPMRPPLLVLNLVMQAIIKAVRALLEVGAQPSSRPVGGRSHFLAATSGTMIRFYAHCDYRRRCRFAAESKRVCMRRRPCLAAFASLRYDRARWRPRGAICVSTGACGWYFY